MKELGRFTFCHKSVGFTVVFHRADKVLMLSQKIGKLKSKTRTPELGICRFTQKSWLNEWLYHHKLRVIKIFLLRDTEWRKIDLFKVEDASTRQMFNELSDDLPNCSPFPISQNCIYWMFLQYKNPKISSTHSFLQFTCPLKLEYLFY